MSDKDPAQVPEGNSDTAAFFGEGTKFTGDFSGRGNIVMCGAIEGDCDLDGPVTLTENGHWKGTIRATDVLIKGTVEGHVIVTGRLEIAPTAVITGSITGPVVTIAKGAVVIGNMDMTGEYPALPPGRQSLAGTSARNT